MAIILDTQFQSCSELACLTVKYLFSIEKSVSADSQAMKQTQVQITEVKGQ